MKHYIGYEDKSEKVTQREREMMREKYKMRESNIDRYKRENKGRWERYKKERRERNRDQQAKIDGDRVREKKCKEE